ATKKRSLAVPFGEIRRSCDESERHHCIPSTVQLRPANLVTAVGAAAPPGPVRPPAMVHAWLYSNWHQHVPRLPGAATTLSGLFGSLITGPVTHATNIVWSARGGTGFASVAMPAGSNHRIFETAGRCRLGCTGIASRVYPSAPQSGSLTAGMRSPGKGGNRGLGFGLGLPLRTLPVGRVGSG